MKAAGAPVRAATERSTILLDGIDLREYDVDSLRGEIGVIFQDYMRYDMLVRENIGFGRIEELRQPGARRERGA